MGDCQDESSSEEAMAAGYAQGVEATEARAIKRIDELEAKVKEYEFRWSKMRERIGELEIGIADYRTAFEEGYPIGPAQTALFDLLARS